MSIISGLDKFPLDEFGGANQRGERTDVTPNWAIASPDCEFEPGYVRTRRGFYSHPSSEFQETNPVAGAYNHLYSGNSWVLRAIKVAATELHVSYAKYDGASASSGGTYSSATPGFGSFAGFGKRVYFALSNAAYDTGQLGCLDVSNASFPNVWIPPLTASTIGTVSNVVTAAVGQITEGNHWFYLLVQSKSGFITRVGIVEAGLTYGIVQPILIAGLAQNSKIVIQITAPGGGWSSDIDNVSLLATTATNYVKSYVVPGTKNTITTSGQTLSFTFDIADGTLTNQPPSTPYENVIYNGLGSGSSSTQPIHPYYCFQAGERLGLFFIDPSLGPSMAFSQPSAYESFALDRSVITLPGLAKAIAGKWVQGTIYIFTEVGTFAYTDTGGDPVTWPPPRVVDSKIGTTQPYGATLDSTGRGFVADTTGLYAFAGGQFDPQSIAYYQPDSWDSIDWADPSFSIVDDKTNWRVVVCCKNLSGNRKLFTWNYVSGFDAATVKYSEYTLTSGSGWNWSLIVKNYTDARSAQQRNQLWIQSNTTKRWMLYRNSLDTLPYRDVDGSTITGINSQYRLAFLPPQPRAWQVNEHHYGLLRIIGNGNWYYRVYNIDDTITITASDTVGAGQPIALSSAPAKELLIGYSLISEAASPMILPAGTIASTPDVYFAISHWAHYWKGYMQRRGS